MELVTNVVHGSESDRLLLLLHGYGADERDLGGLLTYLDPEGHFATVLPRGPVAAPPGFSWYDMADRPGRRVRRGTGRDRRPARRGLRGARDVPRPRRSSAGSRRAAGSRSRSPSGRATGRARRACSR